MTNEDDEAVTAEVAPEIPAAGQDPDSLQRLAKTFVAAGLSLPDGLSVNPCTDNDDDKKPETAAEKRSAVRVSRTTAPQGRSATPPDKARAAE
jgi:hypothetical protein